MYLFMSQFPSYIPSRVSIWPPSHLCHCDRVRYNEHTYKYNTDSIALLDQDFPVKRIKGVSYPSSSSSH